MLYKLPYIRSLLELATGYNSLGVPFMRHPLQTLSNEFKTMDELQIELWNLHLDKLYKQLEKSRKQAEAKAKK